ncbi:MAG TPA: peptidoglycan DD-metalloendopeptidase family protein [Roseiarcus sp.]|nr:peptidoglycan DD-metalloendopeptidase family protein [Roseiarcus sp.]
MSLRVGYPEARPPGSHYCLSLSRGDVIRSIRLGRGGVGALAALALISFAWTASVTVYVAFHDDLMGAILTRQAEMKAAYEDRLAEARARLDEGASRQLLERNSFNVKVNELMSRQARLEQRGAIVAALAGTEARNVRVAARRQAATPDPADALSAIQALGPSTAPRASVDDAARAYAPLARPGAEPRTVKPHPIDESGETLSALPADAPFTTASVTRAADDLDPSSRIALLDPSLDQIESNQTKALAAIDRVAERAASRDATIVAETGLDPARLVLPRGEGGAGGPYIPAELDAKEPARDPALARVARDVATAGRLRALMFFVPLRMPLSGDPSVTSPFGYRADPFLGRLALHPGVDLAEAYGAEIHAAASGRVAHAGPAGGYGVMVEIDHGNGLATRYAHMSDVLVEEGQQVDKGAVLGKLGSTGRSTGPHLHYEVRVDGEPVDPERYLRAGADLAAAE